MFQNLFQPLKINSCTISNRLAVTAMVAEYCNSDGTLTERFMRYHEEKAKGGWGLIITEDFAVSMHGRGFEHIGGLWDASQRKGHEEFTSRIHKYDCKVFAQIYHAGRQSTHLVNGGKQIVAPSSIPCPWKREIPRALTVPEIKQIVADFGNAAKMAQECGYDGIEVHAAHGYLLAEFMSHYANKRTDIYGGCLDNRLRIIHEVIDEIRVRVGRDYPVIIRFSANEGVLGGREIAESRLLTKCFEEWGFDALNVSSGVYGDVTTKGTIASNYMNHAFLAPYTEEIRKIVHIPVILVNRINDPSMADQLIETGKADIIGMGRGSLADPFLPAKAKNGETGSIRYCVGCLQGCAAMPEGGITCLVNPSLGREYKLNYSVTEHPKKVYIAGGGPGGLQAARTAALKGHKVTLFEKQDFLGGQLLSAAFPPGKGELSTYIVWLGNELERLGVDIRMLTPLTKAIVYTDKPDSVIVATGGTAIVPPIKGIDKPHVKLAEDVLLGRVEVGNKIVVAGGGEVGGETASFLATQERGSITIVEMLPAILSEMMSVQRIQLMYYLKEQNVFQQTGTKVIEIKDDEVIVENKNGRFGIEADTVILALGYKPCNALVTELSDADCEVLSIGGAVKTGNALIASREGFDVSMRL
jgi:2,4-dienoyl-CoA reductase-like NADH-dependent reductase (Old Yellow Enzyme family)/thioredoxin reductase